MKKEEFKSFVVCNAVNCPNPEKLWEDMKENGWVIDEELRVPKEDINIFWRNYDIVLDDSILKFLERTD